MVKALYLIEGYDRDGEGSDLIEGYDRDGDGSVPDRGI